MLSGLKSASKIQAKIKNSKLLIPSILEAETISKGIDWLYDHAKTNGFPITSPAQALFVNVFGSMRGNLSHFNFAKDFSLINSFESPNSWHYFEWMIKNESKSISKETLALNSITLNQIKWFGNLDIETIVKAREKSCLQDFREIINRELNYKDEDMSLDAISKQIKYNIEVKFKKHEEKLKDIESDFNFSYAASSAGIVGGTIALLSGLLAQDPVSSIGGGMAIGGSMLSWIKSIQDYNKKEKIINSPIGVLFNVKGDING